MTTSINSFNNSQAAPSVINGIQQEFLVSSTSITFSAGSPTNTTLLTVSGAPNFVVTRGVLRNIANALDSTGRIQIGIWTGSEMASVAWDSNNTPAVTLDLINAITGTYVFKADPDGEVFNSMTIVARTTSPTVSTTATLDLFGYYF